MEIQSAFNTGVQGLQRANEQANEAAANIVAETTAPEQEATLETSNVERENIPDLNQSIVDLKVAEFQARASAQVIQSADESLGTLIDVTV